MPEPLAPPVMVTHGMLLTAVQEQLVPLVTESALGPPIAATLTLVGVTEVGTTVGGLRERNGRPATTIVPVRDMPVVFAATE